jgi:hypothetical protein
MIFLFFIYFPLQLNSTQLNSTQLIQSEEEEEKLTHFSIECKSLGLSILKPLSLSNAQVHAFVNQPTKPNQTKSQNLQAKAQKETEMNRNLPTVPFFSSLNLQISPKTKRKSFGKIFWFRSLEVGELESSRGIDEIDILTRYKMQMQNAPHVNVKVNVKSSHFYFHFHSIPHPQFFPSFNSNFRAPFNIEILVFAHHQLLLLLRLGSSLFYSLPNEIRTVKIKPNVVDSE